MKRNEKKKPVNTLKLKPQKKERKKKPRRLLNSKSRDSTHFENLFENHINFRERVIYLNMEIDEDALELVQKGLDEFDQTPDKIVRIEISSYGGSVYDMLGIIDRIKSSPCEIHTRGFGKIMSAATLILSAGDQRFVGKNTWLMVHQLSDVMARAKLDDLINDVQHDQAIMKQMYSLYEEFSGGKTKSKEWEKLCKKDRYLSASRAVELGLADNVV